MTLPFVHIPLRIKVARFRTISFIEKHILTILSKGIKTKEEQLDAVLSELLNVKIELITELLLPYRNNDYLQKGNNEIRVELDNIIEDTKPDNWRANISIEEQVVDIYYSDILGETYTKSDLQHLKIDYTGVVDELDPIELSSIENALPHNKFVINYDYYSQNDVTRDKTILFVPIYYKYLYNFKNKSIVIEQQSIKPFSTIESMSLSDDALDFISSELREVTLIPQFVKTLEQIPVQIDLNEEYTTNIIRKEEIDLQIVGIEEQKDEKIKHDKNIQKLDEKIISLQHSIKSLKGPSKKAIAEDPRIAKVLKLASDLELDKITYSNLNNNEVPEVRVKQLYRLNEINKEISVQKKKIKELESIVREESKKKVSKLQLEVKGLKDTKSDFEGEIKREFELKKQALLLQKKESENELKQIHTSLSELDQSESNSMRDAFNGLEITLAKNSDRSLKSHSFRLKGDRENIGRSFAIYKDKSIEDKKELFIETLNLENIFNKTIPSLTVYTHDEIQGRSFPEAQIYVLMLENRNICGFLDNNHKKLLKSYRDHYNVVRHEFSNMNLNELQDSKKFLYDSFQQFYLIVEKLLTGYSKLLQVK